MSIQKSIKEMQAEIRELKALVVALHHAFATGAAQPATLAASGSVAPNNSFTKPQAESRASRKSAEMYAAGMRLERMGCKGITRFLPKP